ncbi:unnamed protein product [Schistosoma mattheei]|uniref:Uncharacterized protein n=1 Tax=Schistosoma mattheei TaxID=31246 RepID=A0A183NVC3_9TREM|nr:unnamed protein product [Schistosoma mattheei]
MSRLVSRVLFGARLTFARKGIQILSKPSTIKHLTTSTWFCSSQGKIFGCLYECSLVDRQLNQFLTNEIKQEKANAFFCDPPKGFKVVKTNGCEVVIRKEYQDGVVTPSISEDEMSTTEKSEDDTALEAHPDLRIKLTKPSGRSLVFNCSLPGHDTEKQLSEDESNDLPTYSVDSVEIERIPGYFVYTDLFDDDMYNHTMQLLVERGLDADFQEELQNFCTSEEHKLYLKFLDEFQNYCKD